MLAFDDFKAADARADKDAHPVGNLRGDLEARLGHGLLGGGKGKVDEAPHLARLFFVHELERVKVLDLGGKGGREASGIEALNRPHAAGSGHKLLPNLGRGVAHTAKQPQSGDDDSRRLKGYLPPFAFFSM